MSDAYIGTESDRKELRKQTHNTLMSAFDRAEKVCADGSPSAVQVLQHIVPLIKEAGQIHQMLNWEWGEDVGQPLDTDE